MDIKHSEATKKGLAKAVANGQKLGRPRKVDKYANKVYKLWLGGKNMREIAEKLGISRSTVQRSLKIAMDKQKKG